MSAYRLIFGRPLRTSEGEHERLDKPRALGAFGLDALSSVAYGPDEILYVLLLAGSAGLAWDIPIAVAIVALLAIVVTSYRQTIFAYPHGGGSYTVARENLGLRAGLIAAAALMVDYLTTVAVSVTAGVEALIALAPGLNQYRVPLDVAIILLLMLVNLRGVRESGGVFVLPTYIFIGSLGLLLAWGLFQMTLGGGVSSTTLQPPPAPVEGLSLFLILRAFAGGCTAMTGVEAIANGVPEFEEPQSPNAAATLVILGTILGVLFLGVVTVGHAIGAIPTDQANTVAQIGMTVAGGGPLFYVVQISSAVILSLAANTSFNGFPLLAAVMSRDGYLPHQFSHRGLRLAYSNGIIVLSTLAILLVVAFGGQTHALIPLFAVGVFLCFTLSQSGMVQHWRREQGRGWRTKLAINGLGALTTGVVTLIVVGSKFLEGAWIVVVLIVLLVWLFLAIRAHYAEQARELDEGDPPRPVPEPHTILLPVSKLDLAVSETLGYGLSLGLPMRALHVATDADAARKLRKDWDAWGVDVPLVILPSPYRTVVGPLLHEIHRVHREMGGRVTVLLPEVVPRRWWQEALHNQTVLTLQLALRREPNVVVTTLPLQLRK